MTPAPTLYDHRSGGTSWPLVEVPDVLVGEREMTDDEVRLFREQGESWKTSDDSCEA